MSAKPEVSACKTFIPPDTAGIMAKTTMTRPTPPAHCNNCLYKRTWSESCERSLITVEPVVVNPETASNKASKKAMLLFMNGIEAKSEIITHVKKVITKPSLGLYVNFLCLRVKKIITEYDMQTK